MEHKKIIDIFATYHRSRGSDPGGTRRMTQAVANGVVGCI
jgi:hypothetical protein